MGKMTECVARAIAGELGRELPQQINEFTTVEYSDAPIYVVDLARAAIEAMRDYLNITNNSSLNYTADELSEELREGI